MREMTEADAQAVGMSRTEWLFLLKQLERKPSLEELQMIGVQWSEHCSYKSSKKWLKELITEGPALLQGPGENAGIVAVDEKRAVAFKIESHNHPSFVEPFQGAATGVGGILRDIFTMGARPICTGNFLRFGELSDPKHRRLLRRVVEGIAHYGNCMGIPNLLGQLHTGTSYNSNILVNVFALGVLNPKKIFRSDTAKPGQKVMVWGARTGRDGIHGASLLASADFDESSAEKAEHKIRVQVGDPFKEKCLMEACLEAMEKMGEKIGAIQDMGAAGLTCSSLEISYKSKVGMRLDLDRVPQRESGMQAYELLLSESQERMLAAVEAGTETQFAEILKKWGCEAEVIGECIVEPYLKMSFQGDQVVNLPVSRLMDPPPADLPEPKAPEVSLASVAEPADIKDEWSALKSVLREIRIASKKSVYEQYDQSVGAATVAGSGASAAVIRLGESEEDHVGLAMKGACDESLARVEPHLAASRSLFECARALAMSGATPLGYTDGVNLGNPLRAETQWALSETVKGLNEAADLLETPCVGGNVSLYNQTQRAGTSVDIDPSTFVVMVGRVPDVRCVKPSHFQKAGHEVWWIEREDRQKVSLPTHSVYSRLFWSPEQVRSFCPPFDPVKEKSFCEDLRDLSQQSFVQSLRDINDGGLAVSLAEACMGGKIRLGFDGDLSTSKERRDALLFDESPGRVLVEVAPSDRAVFLKWAMQKRLKRTRVGLITEEPVFRIRPLLQGPTEELYRAWEYDLCAEESLA